MLNQLILPRQRGVSLLEALIAILLFSLGVLGLIALQGRAVQLSSDAKSRADAAFLANQLFAQMESANPATLAQFVHRPNGNPCASTGASATHADASNWLTQVSATLPGAQADLQQIKVDAVTRKVTIGLCWQVNANNSSRHQHVVSSQLQVNP